MEFKLRMENTVDQGERNFILKDAAEPKTSRHQNKMNWQNASYQLVGLLVCTTNLWDIKWPDGELS